MKAAIIFLCLGLLVIVDHSRAQGWPTNNVGQVQAAKIASCLWVGMRAGDVAKVLADKNLKIYLVGGSLLSGWTAYYELSDGCSLHLDIAPKPGSNSWLKAASIYSNDVKIVSITLTNVP
jgi:hypothetical protein